MGKLYLAAAYIDTLILFTEKIGGGLLRICINYRCFNANMITHSWPLHKIDDLLAQLKGARYFSKLELGDGYQQIPLSD